MAQGLHITRLKFMFLNQIQLKASGPDAEDACARPPATVCFERQDLVSRILLISRRGQRWPNSCY